jgi:hypothetical protein
MVEKLDSKYVKEQITKYLNEKGPELPVHIAKHLSMNSLFASAFLSEMASEGLVKISDMKVGGSPLYYTPEKYPMLENFMKFLNEKEREACLLLKEKKILEDSIQHPAIRVALRGLKDFAFAFKKDEKIFWRYFLISEEEVRKIIESELPRKSEEPKFEETSPKIIEEVKEIKKIETKIEEPQKIEEIKKSEEIEEINRQIEEKKKELELIEDKLRSKQEKEPKIKPQKNKKLTKKEKIEDSFLNEIKPLIESKKIQILSLISFDKKHVFALVKINNQDYFLAAYNKKKVDDEDLMKAYKKSLNYNLPYHILSKGEASKKTKEIIEAYKKLSSIELI